jgi:hypothetical protein
VTADRLGETVTTMFVGGGGVDVVLPELPELPPPQATIKNVPATAHRPAARLSERPRFGCMLMGNYVLSLPLSQSLLGLSPGAVILRTLRAVSPVSAQGDALRRVCIHRRSLQSGKVAESSEESFHQPFQHGVGCVDCVPNLEKPPRGRVIDL